MKLSFALLGAVFANVCQDCDGKNYSDDLTAAIIYVQ